MKINQFAHLQVDHQQKINERQKIYFLDADSHTLALNDLYLHFLRCALIEAQSSSAFDQKLHALLATPEQDLKNYLDHQQLTLEVFYTVAMQLLGFEVNDDFEIDHLFEKIDRKSVV